MAQVLGVLKTPDETVSAIESLQSAGFKELEIYSPVPHHAIEEAHGAAVGNALGDLRAA